MPHDRPRTAGGLDLAGRHETPLPAASATLPGAARRLAWLGIAALALGCGPDGQDPVAPLGPDARVMLSTAGTSTARQHFSFVPPLAAGATSTGVFDGSRRPVVTVCRVAKTGVCGTTVATFTRTAATGSELVRVDAAGQLYVTNWRTDVPAVTAGDTYRVGVTVDGQALGTVDVLVVGSQKQMKPGYTQPVTVLKGSTLAIKFRIEAGVPVPVSASSTTTQTVATPTTPEGTSATLVLPAGSLGPTTTAITAEPAATGSVPASRVLVPGTAFDFGPDGTTFARAVTLTITYDQAKLPAGIPEAALGLYWLQGSRWMKLPSRVDASANAVVGTTTHFTTFGVLARVAYVQIRTVTSDGTSVPPDTVIQVGETQQLTAALSDTTMQRLTDRAVTWSVADTLSTVDATGRLTGRYPGLTVVVAESEGRADTLRTHVLPPPNGPLHVSLYNSNFVAPGQIAFARVILGQLSATPVTVALTASDPGAVTLPSSVVVPAGRNWVWITIVGAANGLATVTASAPGFSSGRADLTVGAGKVVISGQGGTLHTVGERVGTRLILPDGPMAAATTFQLAGSSNVRFTDAAGNPITSVGVPARPSPDGANSPGFSDGFYVEALAPGPASVRASHPAFTAAAHAFEVVTSRLYLGRMVEGTSVAPGQVAYFAIGLDQPAAVPLTVTLTPSAPGLTVPASVTVPAGARSVRFGAAASAAGSYAVTATAPGGYNAATAGVSVVAPGRHVLEGGHVSDVGQRAYAQLVLPDGPMAAATTFALSSSGSVRFTDASGSPITSITLPATDLLAPPPDGAHPAARAAFYVEALAAGPGSASVSHPSFDTTVRTYTIRPATLEVSSFGRMVGPNQIQYFSVYLNQDATAPLTVTLTADQSGLTVPASVVVPAGASSATFGVYAATTGQFSFVAAAPGFVSDTAGLGVGSVQLGVGFPSEPRVGQRTRVSVSLSEGPLAVATTLTLTSSAHVRITDANGNPITTLTLAATNPSAPRGSTWSGGSFYVEGLAAGSGWLTIAHPDVANGTHTFTVQP